MAPQEVYQAPPLGEEMMNAVRFHGQNDLRYEQIPVPKIRRGQVKIRPAWVGICGSGEHFNPL
jgi:threonine dehydrogenase-like Zn-dependent dehydrogenase